MAKMLYEKPFDAHAVRSRETPQRNIDHGAEATASDSALGAWHTAVPSPLWITTSFYQDQDINVGAHAGAGSKPCKEFGVEI